MLSKFFIHRPIFATVLAIIVMAVGLFAILNLPVERYPDIAPPRITVSANYSGADAQAVEDSVTQVLEQQIKGIDHLLYFSSSSDASGNSRISLFFEQGTDPDQAQVQVQNAVNGAINRLPDDVQRQGVNVRKSLSDSFMVIGVGDKSGRSTNLDISDYITNNFELNLSRIEGIGEVSVFGSQYAMRIWLDPQRLERYQLQVGDVRTAIENQNTQVAAGAIGALPAASDQYLNAKVTSGSLLRTPEQFENIIVKANADGSFVYLKDVARVEVGAENYQVFNRINGYPASGLSLSLTVGANVMQVADAVYKEVARLEKTLPAGYFVMYPRDDTPFVKESMSQVVSTLIEAIGLVVLVMFIFLQNWRATLIPAITVPVVILGTFAVLAVLGMSINTLTLFAMVLAIGLLVDDAIVVVENVERLMHEQQLSAKQASIQSMQEISGALVGITLVLTAVFIPMSFFSGATGIIYRQFSITLVVAMGLSLLVALILTPALCAILLKPQHKQARWAVKFNQGLDHIKTRYLNVSNKVISLKSISLIGIALLIGFFAWVYRELPSSFLPQEDQGTLAVQFRLPEGTPMSKTENVGKQISDYFLEHEKANLNGVMVIHGRNFSGTGQNLGQAFVSLKHWDERKGTENSAQQIRARAMQYFSQNNQASIMVMMPSVIRGLGNSDKIDFWLQDTKGLGRQSLLSSFQDLQQQGNALDSVENVDKKGNDDQAVLNIKIDHKAAMIHGLNVSDINRTLSTAWSGSYINDFIDRGRIKRVYLQGDAPYRSKPEDLNYWYVKNANGQMVPFSQFSQIGWQGAPPMLERFMGYPAISLEADAASGFSSGQGMQAIQGLVDKMPDVGLAWSGLSYQEQQSSNQAIWLYLISIAFIFLCLAALYESWSIPSVVMAAIPLGVGGTILFSYLFGFANDIYFQIALLTTIGLSCKNAILMVEFAASLQQQGQTALQAALHAAGLRLRPILMTSIAFGAGVIPLMFSSGAGALSRQAIGYSVFGGVVFGTILVLIFIPFMYVLVRTAFKPKPKLETA
ncbi:efflux RND transporter permease subunit [Acinetobacter courvalinii]|uniref:efflux RND transporter permease subunit n=1 Tax=Acinetobacter courvalinii TaxID=280147 RepID=UPI0021D19A78|nr:efflux RND transporter permease subunit [Acinetobacter courvalinii]MCU4368677.1 efflux RND transporter permease subunit [Acinetobacter courvalinii]MCU4446132.1 efflux RND transporter permease subunit [Acinetobacter courvalinii]